MSPQKICIACNANTSLRLKNISSPFNEDLNITIEQAFKDCTGLKDNTMKFFEYICEHCLQELSTTYKFRQKCIETHNNMQIIENEKNAEENPPVQQHKKQPFTCIKCNSTFTKRTSLINHERIHTGERPYNCSECKLSFCQKSTLDSHLKTHIDLRPYQCEYCGQSFTKRNSLNVHKTLHTGKEITCNKCGKLFSKKSDLIVHNRSHTNEKPYHCSQCSNKYMQKCHLDRHMNIHLGIRYTCDDCSKEFTRKYKYTSHMKDVHQKIIKLPRKIREIWKS